MTASQPPVAPSPHKSPFISQSECKSAQKCGLRWFGQWHLALKPSGNDGPAARIGSMAHAVVAACDFNLHRLDDRTIEEAITAENRKRGWWPVDEWPPGSFGREITMATFGARRVMMDVNAGSAARLADGTPLVEHRVFAPWVDLVGRAGLDPQVAGALAVLGRHGIEGQPDRVHIDSLPARDVYVIDDFKFRQKPDLGGTMGQPDTSIVDPQGAFYSVVLRALGVVRDEPVVFRQVNAYAGPWLTVEDFIAEDDRCSRISYEDDPAPRRRLTCNDGLPSADLTRLGAMVSAGEWSEAFRDLATRRYSRRLDDYNNRPAKSRAKPPVRLTDAEEWDARRFCESLRERPLVQEQVCPLDPTACLEVVRDMLCAVLAQETLIARGLTPGRSLDPHPRGDCRRQWGCDLARPCQASIGSNNAAEVFRLHAEDGRLALRVLPTDVGDEPADACA